MPPTCICSDVVGGRKESGGEGEGGGEMGGGKSHVEGRGGKGVRLGRVWEKGEVKRRRGNCREGKRGGEEREWGEGKAEESSGK